MRLTFVTGPKRGTYCGKTRHEDAGVTPSLPARYSGNVIQCSVPDSGLAVLLAMVLNCVAFAYAQSGTPLHLRATIPLPGVRGRIDHMFLDPQTSRLFVAALGNNSVEVIDVEHAKRIQSISGLHEPQGVLYLPNSNRLYVANGEDGTLRIFDGSSYKPIATTNLGADADNIRWDDEERRIYVGYGEGALAVVDEKGSKIGDITLDAHPESFRLERQGFRIFVNVPESRKIAVVDKRRKTVIASWRTDDLAENFPMAWDEADNRLFVVCRRPAKLAVLDGTSGRVLGSWPATGDCDDVFYDAALKRIYATGGEGKVSVFQQQSADRYESIANIPTRKGARTSFFSETTRSLYVAARAEGSEVAAILIYDVLR